MRLQPEPRSGSPERVQQVEVDDYNLGLPGVRHSPAVSSRAGSLAADQLLGMHNRSVHTERGRQYQEDRTSRSSSEEVAATPSPRRFPVRQPAGGQMQNFMQAQLNAARMQAQLQAQPMQQTETQEQPQRVVRLADLI